MLKSPWSKTRHRGFSAALALSVLMSVIFRGVSAAAAAASGNITITPPATKTDDIMVCAVTTRDNVALAFPAGWTIYQEGNNGATLRATAAWKRCVGAEGAFTVTHAAGDGIIGAVAVYKGCVRSGSPINASSIRANASSSTCTGDGITPTVDECMILFSMHDSDDGASSLQKLGAINMVERFDYVSILGLDEAVSISELWQQFQAATGNATGSLTLGPDVNVGIVTALQPEFGLTQPEGAGTKIYVYNDAASGGGTGFSWSDISAAFGADFVPLGTTPQSYRAKVPVQIGDDGVGAKVTTILGGEDTDVKWDDGVTLETRPTQTTSWFFTDGSGVFVGDGAGERGGSLRFGKATRLEGSFTCYGTKLICGSGLLEFVPSGGGLYRLWDTTIENLGTTSSSQIRFGDVNGGLSVDSVLRPKISGKITVGPLVTLALIGAGKLTLFTGSPTAFVESDLTILDLTEPIFIGTPSISDMRAAGAQAVGWIIRDPKWSGAPRFSFAQSMSPDDGAKEAITFDVKVVDRVGAPIGSIPIRLVDTLGTVLIGAFNEITNAQGRLNPSIYAVARDHYAVTGPVYTIRERSPFTLTVNSTTSPFYNKLYLTRTLKFQWPDLTSASFSVVLDIVALQDQLITGGSMEEFANALA